MPTRTTDVANDAVPLDELTLTTATGADGSFSLYEDDGVSTDPAASATTAVTYTEQADGGTLDVAAADGSFDGQVSTRALTAVFTDADRPAVVRVDGEPIADAAWTYDEAARSITVPLADRSVAEATQVSFSSTAVTEPTVVEPPVVEPPVVEPPVVEPEPTQPPVVGAPGAGSPGAGAGAGAGSGVAGDRGPLAFTGSDWAGLLGLVAAGLVTLGVGLTAASRRRAG